MKIRTKLKYFCSKCKCVKRNNFYRIYCSNKKHKQTQK
uniref:Ribosomal protein n=1 Tax=Nephromyces sp. ex Molgula occidentalis TaxID=2544991 RepID=A0A5C1H823_9APIC|nr:50S ribosomal protein L36 [Nephromyces sp. ex Molgula occidentalis]